MQKILLTFIMTVGLAECAAPETSSSLRSTDPPTVVVVLTDEPTMTATQTPNVTEPEAEPVSEQAKTTTTADADVIFVNVTRSGEETWSFAVTVEHPDTGWDDYADGWDVVLPDGTVVKPDPDSPFTRLLLHPHENEQPFTRSQSGVIIPSDVSIVTVRAHDIVDGFGGKEITVDLTVDEGDGFTVTRQ